jgi:hypothetical protein
MNLDPLLLPASQLNQYFASLIPLTVAIRWLLAFWHLGTEFASANSSGSLSPSGWYVPKLGMIHPVLSGIRGEGKLSYGISVDFIVEVEEDAEARVCKDSMCRLGENVIVWKTFFGRRESLRYQVLLDREVSELYYLAASLTRDANGA